MYMLSPPLVMLYGYLAGDIIDVISTPASDKIPTGLIISLRLSNQSRNPQADGSSACKLWVQNDLLKSTQCHATGLKLFMRRILELLMELLSHLG